MSALDALCAPPVIPDIADAGYHEALRVLEDHPATRDMDPMTRMSLAQQLVDAVDETRWDPETLEEQHEEAYEAFKELLSRPKSPQYIRDETPNWVVKRYRAEGGQA